MLMPYGLVDYYSTAYNLKQGQTMDETTFLIIQKFLNIFCNRFRYENLPQETRKITGQNNIIEEMLFFAPCVAWFKDEVLGLQCLPVSGQYDFKITGLPTKWRVTGANGYSRELNEENSVLMFNDSSYSIPFIHTMYEARFMRDCDKTHAQELKAHRRPLVMEMEEDEKKSAEKFVKQLNEFDDIIKIRLRSKDKSAQRNPYNTQIFQATESEYSGKAYMDDYKEFENRVLTYYGINNVNIEKRERLLTGEISANDMLIQVNYTSALNARKSAIDMVNTIFDEDIRLVENELYALSAKNLNTQQQVGFTQYGGDSNGTSRPDVQPESAS